MCFLQHIENQIVAKCPILAYFQHEERFLTPAPFSSELLLNS